MDYEEREKMQIIQDIRNGWLRWLHRMNTVYAEVQKPIGLRDHTFIDQFFAECWENSHEQRSMDIAELVEEWSREYFEITGKDQYDIWAEYPDKDEYPLKRVCLMLSLPGRDEPVKVEVYEDEHGLYPCDWGNFNIRIASNAAE